MSNPGLSIGDVSQESGFSRSALRYYESIGLLEPPERLNGRRRYDSQALDRLLLIRTEQAAGFTLEEIGGLFRAFPAGTPISARWKRLAAAKRAELDIQAKRIGVMKELLGHLESCECDTPAACAERIRTIFATNDAKTQPKSGFRSQEPGAQAQLESAPTAAAGRIRR